MERERRHFIALDTETIRGKAFLLSTASAIYPVESFRQFIETVRGFGNYFVFYNLDYDVTGLIAHLPERTAKLLYYAGRAQVPGGQLRYIPRKYFAFIPASHKRAGLHFYDLYSFFQMSLADAMKKFLPDAPGKLELPPGFFDDFDYDKYLVNKEMFDRYAIRDSYGLQMLADKFFTAIDAAGLACRHYYSPASLAKKYVRARIGHTSPDLSEYEQFLEKSYYGGRIECWQRGYFENVNIYDIKSAYPAVMRRLPDFRHPELWYSKRPEATYYIARCRITSNKPLFPHRSGGRVVFPVWAGQTGYLTNWEIETGRRWGAGIEIENVLNIRVPTDAVLQRAVDELYEKRSLGGMEKQVYKLVLNSLYGVFAQKVKRWRPVSDLRVMSYLQRKIRADHIRLFVTRQAIKCPEAARHWERNCKCSVCRETRRIVRAAGSSHTFELGGDFDIGFFSRFPMRTKTSNLLYAIYTTAGARCQLTEIMMRHAVGFIAAATDSVMMLETMPETDHIGGWDRQYKGWALVVGSGVYQTAEAVKFRGFDTNIDLKAALRGFQADKIGISQSRRESLAYFARPVFDYGRRFQLNELTSISKTLSLGFDSKRYWFEKIQCGNDLIEKNYQSRPFILGREV